MPRRKITRTDVNFWLDATLLVIFLLVVWSSVVVRLVFPPGTQADGWMLWNWDYDQWCGLQFALVCALALTVLVHVMLHWTWVCGVVASRLGRRAPGREDATRTLWGVGLLIVVINLVGVAIALAALMIRSPGY